MSDSASGLKAIAKSKNDREDALLDWLEDYRRERGLAGNRQQKHLNLLNITDDKATFRNRWHP
ncbi:MAG: hypothetical protein SW833_08160 [Cyanobacteriota bacterium]|nr:hypothetical protein [Cyanobacteriota bacterium]